MFTFFPLIETSKSSAPYHFPLQSFDLWHFKTINTIIERDSKDTTYKYALLRGAVEISQEPEALRRSADASLLIVEVLKNLSKPEARERRPDRIPARAAYREMAVVVLSIH
ncbi:MAG: hypothetical protein HGA55_05230 [Methanoregulaceae archaeon]|nr:hypothetical protein [Methanoregulaceae archaeon]